MAIGRMKKITLIGPENEAKKLTGDLQGKAFLEIIHFKEEPDLKTLLPKKVLLDEKLQKRIRKLYFLREALFSSTEKAPEKIQISTTKVLNTVKNFELNTFYEKVKGLDEKIKKKENLIKKLNKLKRDFSLIKEVDLPLCQFLPGRFTEKGIYEISVLQFNDLIKGIERITLSFYLKILKKNKKEILFLLIYPKEEKSNLASLLNRHNAISKKFLPFRLTAAEMLSFIEERLVITEKDIYRLNNEMGKFIRERNKILILFDYYSSLKEQENIQNSFGQTESAFLLTGWIPARNLPNLEKQLKENFPEVALYSRGPKRGEDVPTVLENKTLVEPFEAVTDLYGRPLYKGIDPSALLSIFFILCFATCLSDSGYGFLLAISSFILLKKIHLSGMGKRLCRLFLFSGLATIAAGIITGSCFGDFFEKIPFSPLRKFWGAISVLNPVKNPDDMMKFFYLALSFGYLQISFGVMLRLIKSIKDCGTLLFKNLAPFLIQLGLPLWILAFLSKNGVLPFSFLGDFFFFGLSFFLALAFLSVVFRQFIEQKGIFMKLFWSVYSVYGMVVGNLLSDVLSYSRLFALGMTTALLAIVVNQLVSLVLPLPYLGILLGIFIFCLGHLFNLVINTLGAYVHTSRLQYLEFFTKFYEAGGRAFKPFRVERKYTIIT